MTIRAAWNNFIRSGIKESDSQNQLTQIIYVNTFSVVGITAFLAFGMIHLIFGKIYLGFLEFFIGFSGIINVLILRKTKNYKTAGSIILSVMVLALLGFYIDGGLANTGIYWYYTFPLLAFFLKGKKKGILWVSTLYCLTILTGCYFHFVLIKPLHYSYIQIQQLLASLFAVSMLVYFYEKVRERNEKTIQETQQKIVEKKLLEEEIKIAETLQRSLLPQKNLILDDIDFVGFYKPSLGVSGDYYDFFEINSNQVAAVLCDVSGKGIPAAFVMINIRAVFRTLIKRTDENLQSISAALNDLMNQEVGNNMFTTLFAFIYNRDTRSVNFINAGHGPFTYFSSRSGKIREVEMPQLPLGIENELFLTEEINLSLESGDIITIFSDGITDALNSNNQEFGKKRIFDIILKHKDLKANAICRALIKEIKYYCKNSIQRDDISLIIAKVK